MVFKLIKGGKVVPVGTIGGGGADEPPDAETVELNRQITDKLMKKDTEMRGIAESQRLYNVMVRELVHEGGFRSALGEWTLVSVQAHDYSFTPSGGLIFIRHVYLGNPAQGLVTTWPYAWAAGMWHSVMEITDSFQPRVN